MTRGILFDSGGVLTRPVGGRWNPRFDFEEVLQRHHLGAPPERFEAAFRVGQAHLDAEDTNKARDDYHRAILRELGVDDPTADLLAELDRPLDVPVLETFPEVPEVLAELRRRGIRMAVVTDNWGTAPSNRALFDQIGIGHYFETFAVSEELGCAKPDPRIFEAARAVVGLEPAECLFVDDDPDLVRAARELGYQAAAMCRPPTPPNESVPSVADLRQVLDLV